MFATAKFYKIKTFSVSLGWWSEVEVFLPSRSGSSPLSLFLVGHDRHGGVVAGGSRHQRQFP
jgi:hypothetical protein